MTNSMKEALDAAKKAHDESFDGISHDCFHKGWQAATAAADAEIRRWKARCIAAENGHFQVKEATAEATAKYLLVIERLVEAAIKKALDNYTLLNQIDATNEDSLPIVDALTPPWETNITKGQEEVDNIIECIMYEVRETLAATLLAGKRGEV